MQYIVDPEGYSVANAPKPEEEFYYTKTYFTFLYYSNYTLFTQGFGDVYPKKVVTRLSSCVQMIIAFVFTAYIFGKVIANSESRSDKALKKVLEKVENTKK